MAIYDRIDLKPIGTWTKNFRPVGMVLNFGNNIVGGTEYSILTGPGLELPFGATVTTLTLLDYMFDSLTMQRNILPVNADGVIFPGAAFNSYGYGIDISKTSAGVEGPYFSSMFIPAGTQFRSSGLVDSNGTSIGMYFGVDTTLTDIKLADNVGAICLPWGVTVSGHVDGFTASDVILSKTDSFTIGAGSVTSTSVLFGDNVQLEGVLIPFGTNFLKAINIGSDSYPAGVYQPSGADLFDMNTIQLIDVNNKAITSVHGVSSGEIIAFNTPTADIGRLVMYKDGVGVDTPIFACYTIIFKTIVTAAQVAAFNKDHPSDVNPIIIDNGSASNPNIILPV